MEPFARLACVLLGAGWCLRVARFVPRSAAELGRSRDPITWTVIPGIWALTLGFAALCAHLGGRILID